MKKVVKIIILLICVTAIAVAGVKFFGNSNSSVNNIPDGEIEQIAMWESPKSDNGCILTLTFYSNDTVNIDRMLEYSSNAFYKIDDFMNLDYASKLISEEAEYSSKTDGYIGVVPNDCVGVQVDGTLYKSQEAEVVINDSTVKFKYVIADFKHDDSHKISLIDENRREHKVD